MDDEALAALSALGDPLRRDLYRYAAGQEASVSRDEAASALGVTRSAAVFHLDRLVEDGLLTVEFRRLSGRGGPGAGRPSKLYKRADREIAVALPPRQYDLAADLMATAVRLSTETGEEAGAALRAVARDRGRALASPGAPGVSAAGGRRSRSVARAAPILAKHGYEPHAVAGGLVLFNCPFHRLVGDHREVVCGMNLALVEGVLEGLQAGDLEAVPDPQPSRCCVRITRKQRQEK